MSKYYDRKHIQDLVDANRHRNAIGGMWDEIGMMQLDALKSLGLRPGHSVLDVGCGSLRLGARLTRFLDAGDYFGTDLNQPLIDAGYARELDDTLRAKLPRDHLFQHDVMQPLPFKRTFDYLVAFSLFTHLSYAQAADALTSMAAVMSPSSQLLATFFVTTEDPALPQEHLAGITTYLDQDPFHLTEAMIRDIAADVGLEATVLKQFQHPRGQTLLALRQRA